MLLTINTDGDWIPVPSSCLCGAWADIGPLVVPGHSREDELVTLDTGLAIRQRPPIPGPWEAGCWLPASLELNEWKVGGNFFGCECISHQTH